MVTAMNKLRAALLASTVFALASAPNAQAQNVTWSTTPTSGDLNNDNNWIGGSRPPQDSGGAYFGASTITSLETAINNRWNGGLTLNADAGDYTITTSNYFSPRGIGIVVNGGSLTLKTTSTGMIEFSAPVVGTVTFINDGSLFLGANASAGNINIVNTGQMNFQGDMSGRNAALTSNAGGIVDFRYSLFTTGRNTLGSLAGNGGEIYLSNGELTIGTNGRDTTYAGVISNCGDNGTRCWNGQFGDPMTGSIVKTGSGTLTLTGVNTYSGGTTFAGGALSVSSDSNLGSGDLTFNGGILQITGTSFNSTTRAINWRAGGGGFDIAHAANTFEVTQDLAGSGGLIKRGAGTLLLSGANDYHGVTSIEAGTLRLAPTGTTPVESRHDIAAGATFDLNGHLFAAIGALTGAGIVTTTAGNAKLITGLNGTTDTFAGTIKDGALGTVEVWVGRLGGTGTAIFTGANTYSGGTTIGSGATLQIGDGGTTGSIIGDVRNGSALVFNRSNTYTFAGVIGDDFYDPGTGPQRYVGTLTQAGSGNTILTGISNYTGRTIVNAGTLSINGSIASSVLTTVNASGTLGGTGTVGDTLINGGTLAPGNSIGTLTVQGNLAFTSAARYLVDISPASSDRTDVTGTATLGGAAVNASFTSGSYVAKRYTILNAAGGFGGSTFGAVVNTNLPENFKSSLSYDNTNAYLDLELIFVRPATTGASSNQQGVGNALVGYFNSNGGIPLVYGGLTANGLTQISGETATGSQQAGINAMTQFMGMMMDPSSAGRSDAPPAASGFAATDAMAYAPEARGKAPRDAYAAITKAMPRAASFEQRWSVWSAGFGGSQTTDGNAAAGSNSATSRIYGAAAGADVWLSPTTLAGISMAGGATSFSVAQGGTGQSDLVQVGGFVRHGIGSAYLSAAFAYGWQDITTERLVTVVGADRLRARFNANSYAGRVELGSRGAVAELNGIGVTPYVAGQITILDLPAYAESVVSGSNAFALGYTAKTVMAPRTELGLRTDKAFALDGALLTLRGRAAWAHDFNTDRAASATFQALPGASFVVNGAAAARDAALTSASTEVEWTNGFALAATFEGEFSETTRSYAGKGLVRYTW